jgi:hypothetical protein
MVRVRSRPICNRSHPVLTCEDVDVHGLVFRGLAAAILLSYFALPVEFSTAALWMAASALFCRYIPKRLH